MKNTLHFKIFPSTNLLPENWDDLPDTISAMIELVIVGGQQKILINNAGGSSAANLLGRFCHGDNLLNNFTHCISKFEENVNNDKKEENKNPIPSF